MKRKMLTQVLSLTAWLLLTGAVPANARAESVGLSLSQNYHQLITVPTSDLWVSDFRAEVAGTVSIRLQDLAFVEVLQSLTGYINSVGNARLTLQGGHSLLFEVEAQQQFSASIYALARGIDRLGAYALDVSLTPKGSVVPIPAAGWLLLSALGVLGIARRQTAVTHSMA